MGHKIHDREYHARRIAARHLRQRVRPWGLRMDLMKLDDNEPRLKSDGPTATGFTTEHEAELFAQMNAQGRYWYVSYFTRMERGVPFREWTKTYYVRFQIRVGAPFREPSMTWEYQEEERAATLNGLKRWKKESDGLYGKSVKPHRDRYHRLWRRAGKQIGHYHLRGLDDSHLDPQPERLGIMWQVI